MSLTLATLRTTVQRRIGDPLGKLWTAAEVDGYLVDAYQELAQTVKAFWDAVYLENLPRGFSYTHAWERSTVRAVSGRIDYGAANYTFDDERDLLTDRNGPGTHTNPAEAALCDRQIAGLVDVPTTLTALERVTWDERTIDALDPRRLAATDTRYRLTEGEVYGYTWRAEGVRALRKVRVPAAQASVVTVTGAFGDLRDPTDLSGDTVTTEETWPLRFSFTALFEQQGFWTGPYDRGQGTFTASWESVYATLPTIGPKNHTMSWEYDGGFVVRLGLETGTAIWGLARRIPGHHPIGPEAFGLPRRPFLDATNVRVEYYRQGRALSAVEDVCELPDRYALYLQDYAQAQCLNRAGPGQDVKLGQLFGLRWARHLARLERRTLRVTTERVGVFGGSRSLRGRRPPRPSWPAHYPVQVR